MFKRPREVFSATQSGPRAPRRGWPSASPSRGIHWQRKTPPPLHEEPPPTAATMDAPFGSELKRSDPSPPLLPWLRCPSRCPVPHHFSRASGDRRQNSRMRRVVGGTRRRGTRGGGLRRKERGIWGVWLKRERAAARPASATERSTRRPAGASTSGSSGPSETVSLPRPPSPPLPPLDPRPC